MSHDFDSLDSSGGKQNDKPIWALDLNDDDAILKWLNTELKHLEHANEDRIREIQHNMARYRGIQYLTQDTRAANRDAEAEKGKYNPRIVVNNLHLVTELRVSRLVKYRPAVSILPTNDEHKDKLAAQNAKRVDDHIAYTQHFELKFQEVLRLANSASEGYLDTVWNPDLGEDHPDYDPENPQPLLDDKGEQVLDEDGKPRLIEHAVKQGDVEHRVLMPDQVFLQQAKRYDEADYAFILEPIMTEKLKVDYPSIKDKIKSDGERRVFNYDSLQEEKLVNQTMKITFIHKKTRYCPKGLWIEFTKDVILEKGKHKYKHGDFTFDRMPGIQTPGRLHADSPYSNLKGLAAQYNTLTSNAIKHLNQGAHAKWFVPHGSVKLESLGNDFTIVQYRGGQPPVLAQGNPLSPQVVEMRKEFKNEILEHGMIGDVQRGVPPAGVKAGVALMHLSEQEANLLNAQIIYLNNFVRSVTKKRLAVASQFYDPSDRRTIMVMGHNKDWVSMNFDPSHFARSFDVRVQESSALPDSKSGRMQYILDMAERFPDLMPREQIVEILGLGIVDKFDDAAAGIRAAEYENERLMNGEKVKAPEVWELHILHWRAHTRAIQDPYFKEKLPPEIQQNVKDHIMATEMLMVEMAEKSPVFAQQLTTLQQFPMFFTPPPIPQMDLMAGAMMPAEEMPMDQMGENPPIDPMAMEPMPPMPSGEPIPDPMPVNQI